MDADNLLNFAEGFQWDKGNKDKNLIKHGVAFGESEEVFFNKPLFVYEDVSHSTKTETRYYCLGRTDIGRLLFIVFTLRKNRIRVISAREMNKKEKEHYAKKT